MVITTKTIGDVEVVALGGRIDAVTSYDLDTHLKQLLADGHTKMVADMAGVHYISSSGLRVLLGVYKECQKVAQGELKLAAVQPEVAQILDVTGFSKLLKSYETVETAIENF